VGVQTPTEIAELSLRTPRPVAILSVRKRSDSNTVLSVRKRSDSNTVLSVRKRSDSNTVLSVRKRSDSNNNTRLSDQHHVGPKPLADVTDFEEELFEFTLKNSDTMTLERN